MNKFLFLGLGLIILTGVGAVIFFNQQTESADTAMMTSKTEEAMTASPVAMTESPTTMAKAESETAMMPKTESTESMVANRYVPFSSQMLDKAQDTRRVLFFYASWCPTCRPADKNFTDEMQKIPADVTVIRVNYNDPDTDQTEKDLVKKYGITYQHTFVQIDATGKEVAKWNGGQLDELLENLQ